MAKEQVQAERIEKAYLKLGDTLNERETEVICRYYGITPHVRHSLKELGERFLITRERIRQIKSIALTKLKIKK